jgi:Spy/CpxP family protein refolding chaperone
VKRTNLTTHRMRLHPILYLAALLSVLGPSALRAQEAPDKALGENLFAPELVMQNQQKLSLKPEQRAAITQAVQQLQNKVVELQWRMQEEGQRLAELLQRNTVSESEALAQVDRVLAVERDVKRAHIAMLIRIKNTLTPEQQGILKGLR